MKDSMTFQFNGFDVIFKTINGQLYVNATQMAKPFENLPTLRAKKSPSDWLQLPSTERLLAEAKHEHRSIEDYEPVITQRGLPLYGGGTWFHYDVADEFARWVSPNCFSWYKKSIRECGGSAVEPETKPEVIDPVESNSIMNLNAHGSQRTMSSREIAQITGKNHKEVMRDIRNVEPAYIQVYGNERRFALVDYRDKKGEARPEYHLNQSQALFLASGYDSIIRAKIQFRWEQLEQKQLDFSDPNVVFQLAKNWKEETEKRIALEQENKLKDAQLTNQNLQLRQAAPKVEYHDQVLFSKEAHNVTVMAKTFNMSAMALNKFLYEQRIQFRTDRKKGFNKKTGKQTGSFTWVPYARYVNDGYCKVDTITIPLEDGTPKSIKTLVWFEKGQRFIYDLLKKHGKLNGDVQGKLGI